VLRKLDRYRLGGESSDRQWRDITAILRVQHGRLDEDHLDTTGDCGVYQNARIGRTTAAPA